MYALELKNINKSFGDVHANKNICLQIPKGTIHGIVGENGAGKSTLMSIIYGFYEPDNGEILVNGNALKINDSCDAIAAGIGMVHQHFMLVENFTVLENVLLGAEDGAMLNESLGKARKRLEKLEEEFSLEVNVDAIVERLSVGLQQRVEILKALYRDAKILILDEPTGVLTPQETKHLFKILNILKEQGVTIVLITHKLQEILDITDNVSVMRQGEMVAHTKTKGTTREELAELMVGRKVRLKVDKSDSEVKESLLSIQNLSVIDHQNVPRVNNVSLEVKAGEVVGIAGVSGNGQSELLEAIAGITAIQAGKIQFAKEAITPEHPISPDKIRKLGVAHVPEDRHKMGMVTKMTASEAAILGYHNDKTYNGRILMDLKAVEQDCAEKMQRWDVRPPKPELKSANFSGGNQQKLIIAREVEQNPDVLLIGQPTRGVDIGAIEFIHEQVIKLRDAGKAVLLVSVELEEIMALADRIVVMFDGQIVGEVAAKDADELTLGLMMANAAGNEDNQQEN
ncbi:ABC transporter ATP-binding protein [Algicola sagamiensis]|uniref:ABC transporter ATP-binding protein n=1 Tax=Algicola sagamiensis TaxID=163869 RepID=UPI00036933B7|nr:ABC transporter ATP-binding protein [Algicola sagamiensis]